MEHPEASSEVLDMERVQKALEAQKLLEGSNKLQCAWVTCLCVVTFDLEYGQKLEHAFPVVPFTDRESVNISFSSFPDSNSSLSGDIVFSFRHKKDTEKENVKNPGYFYGYVFFRQEKDASIRRGYLQKSVVLISDFPYYGLFKKVVSLIGPLYFQYGDPLLEASYQNLASWPDPRPGTNFELPFVGHVLSFHVPFSSSPHIIDPRLKKPLPGSRQQLLVSNLESINLYKCYQGILTRLWTLWELMLIGEPLLVLSPTPPECSDAVLGLVSLIAPLTYGGDFRPFFTIHDSDFKEVTNPGPVLPSFVVGATNPFFCKALEHWPHVLSIGVPPARRKNSLDGKNKLVSDFKEELKTKYKPVLSMDKDEILDQLDTKSGTPESITNNNEILRRHFLQLTESFMVPLERYFSSLMPLVKEISIFRQPPRLKVFNEREFLDILAATSKKEKLLSGKLDDLYDRFIRSPNFKLWFVARRKEAITKLNSMYIKALVETDIKEVIKERKEVEIIDLMIRVKQQLETADSKGHQEVVEKLALHLEVIVSCLPNDLQASIRRVDSPSLHRKT